LTGAPSRRALITGIAGQDGSYLAELLCAEGVDVHGVVRNLGQRELPLLAAVRERVTLHDGDLLAAGRLRELIGLLEPDELYHLASPSFVPHSWERPAASFAAIAGASAELLEAVRELAPKTHVVLASSREIFGADAPSPQDERTAARPSTPYGVAKLAAQQLGGLLRERDGIHVSSAILYNHESPRRPEWFVTRKVTRAAAAISLGRSEELVLGELDVVRDWSSATDVVRGMRAMAAAPLAADYVLASGVGRSVRELVGAAFALVGLDPEAHVRSDPSLSRPRERSPQIGNPQMARRELGWQPRQRFEELIAEMVAADLAELGAV